MIGSSCFHRDKLDKAQAVPTSSITRHETWKTSLARHLREKTIT
jgi:hypothetical protein